MNTKTLAIQSLKMLQEDSHGIPYAILQVKRGDEYHDKQFECFDRTVKTYGTINLEDYDFKGAFGIGTKCEETDMDLLEEIFRIWNQPTRPTGTCFTGHSLSVSDIVALNRDDKIRFYFCDSFGFRELENELTLLL